ncbi:MAG: sulfur carrier protein ThiS [Leptospirales bacterium]|nr:sulfur carrier protein ThiS [Leptospirales bacterium]
MQVNGEERDLAQLGAVNLLDLVRALGIDPRLIAAQLNGAIIPRGAWADTALQNDDCVELIRFVGGG